MDDVKLKIYNVCKHTQWGNIAEACLVRLETKQIRQSERLWVMETGLKNSLSAFIYKIFDWGNRSQAGR